MTDLEKVQCALSLLQGVNHDNGPALAALETVRRYVTRTDKVLSLGRDNPDGLAQELHSLWNDQERLNAVINYIKRRQARGDTKVEISGVLSYANEWRYYFRY